MSMTRRTLVNATLMMVVICAAAWSRAEVTSNVLLVPERYRLVQFGAEVGRMCEIPLITYDSDVDAADGVRIHSWSPTQQAWRALTLTGLTDAVGEGRLGNVLLVGRELDLPKALTDALTGTPVARINTLELAQVANGLHEHLARACRAACTTTIASTAAKFLIPVRQRQPMMRSQLLPLL